MSLHITGTSMQCPRTPLLPHSIFAESRGVTTSAFICLVPHSVGLRAPITLPFSPQLALTFIMPRRCSRQEGTTIVDIIERLDDLVRQLIDA